MLEGREQKGLQPAIGRRRHGYDIGAIWCQQRHAIIHRGQRRADAHSVLIKLLRDLQPTDTGAEWLQRDYEIGNLLRAKCAVKPLAFEQTDSGPAIVYADNGARPLKELSDKAPLDIDTVLTIGAGIAEAVDTLHKEGLTHCNLNPTTIWLNDDADGVLISDFACARHPSARGAAPRQTRDEPVDIRYISPEQTGHLQRTVDQRTDIYSLGIILFQLLTGKLLTGQKPDLSFDPLHIIDCHNSRQPEELRSVPSAVLANVVRKALEKSPKGRYQSASGLLADLLECRSQWQSDGTIKDFELGRYDAKGVFRSPRRLYGRERDIEVLQEKISIARRGRPVLLLIKGAAGVGKSKLLGKLEEFVSNQDGYFVSGKYDQYKRNVPYLALIQALQQLIGQFLAGPPEQVEALRSRILDAVGKSGRIAIDVIPKLKSIIGDQPDVPALPPTQARNRFNRVFTRLIQAFVPRDRMLCLVMDDLHWVDRASLDLLVSLLNDAKTKKILIAGAYRENEVDENHPIENFANAYRDDEVDENDPLDKRTSARNGSLVAFQEIQLKGLEEPDCLELIRETFNTPKGEACELAQIVYSRTAGNALYMTQLLQYLCDKGLIAFEHHSGKWNWDLPRIRREGITADILELLGLRLGVLQEDTRTILATASCAGNTFDVGRVAVAAGCSKSEVLRSMTIGVEEGLIAAIEDEPAEPNSGSPSVGEREARYRFIHDRIQQAAFESIPDDAKRDFRLQIGRRLMASLSRDDERVPQLDVLSNINYAWNLLTDEKERQRVARMNLVAGRKARQALAYQEALGYISIGLGLLIGAGWERSPAQEKAWQTCYELAFDLHSEALECEYLSGNLDRAEQIFRVLIANAKTEQEKARTYLTKILLDTSEERYDPAIQVGIAALQMFGVRYRKDPSRLDMLLELIRVRVGMRGRRPQDLMQEFIKAEHIDSAEQVDALSILVALFPTAYFLSPDLLMYTGLKVVNYSLRYGLSPLSAGGFVLYGLGLGAAMDDHKRGYDFGRFAVELAEKGNNPTTLCKVLVIFSQFVKFWRDAIDESFPLIDRARKMAKEVGDHQYADYAIIGGISLRFSRGETLHEVLLECEKHRPFVMRSKDAFPVESLKMWNNCVLALQGKTSAPYSLNNGDYYENASEAHYQRTKNFTLASYQNTLRLQLACLFGRDDDALALSEKGEALIRSSPGYITVADHYLYRGLATAMALTRHDTDAAGQPKTLLQSWLSRLNHLFVRMGHRRRLRRCLARLHLFAVNSPDNFKLHEALLEAENARARGQFANALKHYDRAIKLAETRGFRQLVGLANERAALCCIANEHHGPATFYLNRARAAYDEWGAAAKVAWLEREYATLLPALASTSDGAAIRTHVAEERSTRHKGVTFDITTALEASDIIAIGQNGDQELTNLLELIRVHTDAEAAHMVVQEGGKLRLKASSKASSSDEVLVSSSSADIRPGAFSPAIVNYVLNTNEDLMLEEADVDPLFKRCSYVAERHPKSVICVPLRHRGEIGGVIYLEHTRLSRAFDENKLKWVRIYATNVGLTLWGLRQSRYRGYVQKLAPRSLFEQIDANPESPDLAVKDRDVSILFADLAGYTRISELMEVRHLYELRDRMLSQFIDDIERYQGEVEEFPGSDELFAIFEDEGRSRHARKAAKAALAIADTAIHLNKELSEAPLPVIMNIGINSGVVSVGKKEVHPSSGPKLGHGPIGAEVNVAHRICEVARDGSILVSEESAARLRNDFELEDMGEHKLKNVTNRIRIYRLKGERNGQKGTGS
jgi:histidine kinase